MSALRDAAALKPDINVTPLVDVVLVLLIIFMVVMPQMEKGPPVDIPGIFNADPKTKAKLDPVVVSVTAAGQVYLEKEPVALADLAAQIKAQLAAEPRRRIVIKGDKRARYAAVREVFKICQDVGIAGASLQVGDRPKAEVN